MSKLTVYLLALFIVALDQFTKHWAVQHLAFDTPSVVLIPKVLYLTRTTNTGSAFGLFPGATQVLALAALAAAIGIAYYVGRSKTAFSALIGVALALPLGGALGNFLDRARLSYVVDFIDLRIGTYQWPVFNVADSAICVGVVLLAVIFLRNGGAGTEGSRSAERIAVEPSTGASE